MYLCVRPLDEPVEAIGFRTHVANELVPRIACGLIHGLFLFKLGLHEPMPDLPMDHVIERHECCHCMRPHRHLVPSKVDMFEHLDVGSIAVRWCIFLHKLNGVWYLQFLSKPKKVGEVLYS